MCLIKRSKRERDRRSKAGGLQTCVLFSISLPNSYSETPLVPVLPRYVHIRERSHNRERKESEILTARERGVREANSQR